MHAFFFDDGETKISISNTNLSIPWVELTELYFNFLQAAGYSLTREDFASAVQDNFI